MVISTRIAVLMAIATFAAGSFLAPPVQQAIAAVIATDVQCTGCVGSSDVAGNAITAAKIKDGEVKAAEIATDAVGAAELQGVTKLLFAECSTSNFVGSSAPTGAHLTGRCNISGVDSDDNVVATKNGLANFCFSVVSAAPFSGGAEVELQNNCGDTQTFVAGDTISIIVYDK